MHFLDRQRNLRTSFRTQIMASALAFRDAPSWLVLVVGLAATLLGGALYGRYSQRWGPPADLTLAAQQLTNMPRELGEWTLAEEFPLQRSAVEMLQCAGYVNRNYVNRTTGESISVAIIVGPPGPIAVHTPEICFSSRSYQLQGSRHKVQLETSSHLSNKFWRTDFTSKNILAEGLRVHYAWSRGNGWEASASPRYEFAAAPLLYKIQLAAPLKPKLGEESSDSGREFLKALMDSGWELPRG